MSFKKSRNEAEQEFICHDDFYSRCLALRGWPDHTSTTNPVVVPSGVERGEPTFRSFIRQTLHIFTSIPIVISNIHSFYNDSFHDPDLSFQDSTAHNRILGHATLFDSMHQTIETLPRNGFSGDLKTSSLAAEQ